MTINGLTSWLTIGSVQCVTNTLVYSLGKPIPMGKTNYPSNKETMYYNLYWITQIYGLPVDNLHIYKEPMTCILYATFYAPKSHIM